MEEERNETPVETFKDPDIYTCIKDIADNPQYAKSRRDDIQDFVDNILKTNNHKRLFKEADKRDGETVLHTAIKRFDFTSDVEKEVADILVKKFPKMILEDRSDSPYEGQTPLHMGVCKGNIWIVHALLAEVKKHRNWRTQLLRRRATGSMFHNTVMMAEIPLSIAALTFNKGMVDLLLDNGAELDNTNQYGDNVCHSLIRYAFLYPEKSEEVLDMCRYISDDPKPFETDERAVQNRKLRKKIWLMQNQDQQNPLQLAAIKGQHQIFTFIMNSPAYCHANKNDGLFDIKIYDVTEIDAISSMKRADVIGSSQAEVAIEVGNIPSRRAYAKHKEPYRKSVMSMLLDLDPACAFHFLLFPPFRRIIDEKWNSYRKFFYPLWIFHFLFMCFLTWYSVERAQHKFNTPMGFNVTLDPVFKRKVADDPFAKYFGVVAVIIGAFFIALEAIRYGKRRMPLTLNSFANPYSNGWFRTLLVLFGLLLILDFFMAIWFTMYENYCLIMALILGWFGQIFYLRSQRPFSFFTVLITKVLIGDMFRFFVVIGLELLAFSTAIYMVIQGSEVQNDPNYSDFGRVLFSMTKLMVGLGDAADLYSIRDPVLGVLIFYTFIIFTTLLMINALIAMMSRTCSELIENVGNINALERHWKLQRLSVILWIESILPNGLVAKSGKVTAVRRYNDQTKRRKEMKRYLMEIRSLQDDGQSSSSPDSEMMASPWGLKTFIMDFIGKEKTKKPERPLSGLSDKLRNLFKKNQRSRSVGTSDGHLGPLQFENHIVPQDNIPVAMVPVVPEAAQPEVLDIYNVNTCPKCSQQDVTEGF